MKWSWVTFINAGFTSLSLVLELVYNLKPNFETRKPLNLDSIHHMRHRFGSKSVNVFSLDRVFDAGGWLSVVLVAAKW